MWRVSDPARTVAWREPAMGRIVILAGPSCVGKSPMLAALKRKRPELAARLETVVLYNSRSPRPHEADGVDYHFRSRREIEALRGDDSFVVIEARRDLQAISLDNLSALISAEKDACFEGNPFAAGAILEAARNRGAATLSIFVSPLGRDEIEAIRSSGASPAELVFALMKEKLLRRTARQKDALTDEDIVDIDARAGSAYRELAMAADFDYVIVNHDGEDSDHWTVGRVPFGDARRSVQALASLLMGNVPECVERWDDFRLE